MITFLLSDQNINWFLIKEGTKPQISYSTIILLNKPKLLIFSRNNPHTHKWEGFTTWWKKKRKGNKHKFFYYKTLRAALAWSGIPHTPLSCWHTLAWGQRTPDFNKNPNFSSLFFSFIHPMPRSYSTKPKLKDSLTL